MILSKPELQFQVEQNTVLCLACSSSLPPGALSKGEIFLTKCCHRPICPTCTTSNPRLARYNPCLACLGGVSLIGSSSTSSSSAPARSAPRSPDANIDGSVRDVDNFQIGDDSDEESDLDSTHPSSTNGSLAAPPSYKSNPPSLMNESFNASSTSASSVSVSSLSDSTDSAPRPSNTSSQPDNDREAEIKADSPPTPTKYYLKKGDTLQGIALRFGVSGRELCQLNKLPPSTISTTPHLLHTRAHILLPPSALRLHQSTSNISPEEEAQREAERARERAEKKLQTLTKEVDWRVAKAYVALAENANEEDVDQYHLKQKESSGEGAKLDGKGKDRSKLEMMAVDAYLDDEEWEARNPYKPGSSSTTGSPGTRSSRPNNGGLKQWMKW